MRDWVTPPCTISPSPSPSLRLAIYVSCLSAVSAASQESAQKTIKNISIGVHDLRRGRWKEGGKAWSERREDRKKERMKDKTGKTTGRQDKQAKISRTAASPLFFCFRLARALNERGRIVTSLSVSAGHAPSLSFPNDTLLIGMKYMGALHCKALDRGGLSDMITPTSSCLS